MSTSAFKNIGDSDEGRQGLGRPVWICILIAIVLLLGGGTLTWWDFVKTAAHPDWMHPGTSGDFWGGHVSAASTLAGTILLFGAILLQSRELSLQRRELEENRRVAEEQARALEKQSGELRKQNALTESRDELQHLLSVSDRINSIHTSLLAGVERRRDLYDHPPIGKDVVKWREAAEQDAANVSGPLLDEAFRVVVRRGRMDASVGQDRCRLMCSLCSWIPMKAFESRLRTIAAESRSPSESGGQGDGWLNDAIATCHQSRAIHNVEHTLKVSRESIF